MNTLKSEKLTGHDPRVAQAEAYVRSRFYPPLPAEYGQLAVDAVDLLNAGEPEAMIDVSHLNPQPRGTTEDGFVRADRLVEVLRLEHMIEQECEACAGHGHIELPHPSDPSEAGREIDCDYCGGSGTI